MNWHIDQFFQQDGERLISGRKAFQRLFNEGVELLNTIQDVYLEQEISVA